ncbi:amidohydrolase [Nesterenkonia alkaliphila]|uniref:Amidohydrolase n=1 Tax=Nesterenkonia alkaliphila TaxID=1463631 RepID=A0A7K1UJI9_9MICC|nr:amidohydrolase [Nesterenkonia alkaliphila]MVT26630.1 amidohydrolase [Nesterenkonia alkaliphila]GFZ92267.1 amidohydrolase [Nesterenkonia alkaliphila]
MSYEAEAIDVTARVDAEVDRATRAEVTAAEIIDELEDTLIEFRRDLHAHPELSWQEERTTEQIVARLREAGLEPVRLPETTGCYVDVGPAEAPIAAAFRGDIDALPIIETTGLEYASTTEGVAHSCGHDIHTTVMLGLAWTLQRLRPEARVRIIFQPAEEQFPGGAQEVVKHGVLEGVPKIFALHCDPKLTVGAIGTRIGPITSASDLVRVEVTGRGGHTSRPHLTEDVVGALGHIATSVPAVLARRIDARSGVSLVWGHIHAGNAANAIPSEGTLHGTMRILDADAWKEAGGVLSPVVQQAAAAYGVDVNLDHVRGVPPVVNDEACTGIVDRAAKRALGEDSLTLAEQSMGGEDFGWMTQEVPGSMFRLGTKTPGGESYDLHRGDYIPDERAIAVGVKVMAEVAQARLAAR